ncbi:MAG: DUF2149 domain-containing protein [Firmicutes bacterium]|nr:DUF2149 domain-containing protein [Bacillota bacterium]
MSLRNRRNLRTHRKQDDFNPMDGMANLADVMLVFACGLILALIINWNVDVSSIKTQQPNVTYEVEGVESDSTQTIDGESELEEMGTVYRDPETGKYYVVEGE